MILKDHEDSVDVGALRAFSILNDAVSSLCTNKHDLMTGSLMKALVSYMVSAALYRGTECKFVRMVKNIVGWQAFQQDRTERAKKAARECCH